MRVKWLTIPLVLIIATIAGCKEMNKSGAPDEGEEGNPYLLSTTVLPENSGEVTPTDAEYEDGEYARLRAVPADGFVFAGWDGDHNGSRNPDSLRMDQDKHVVVEFSRKTYTLHVQTEGNGQVLESLVETPAKKYEEGAQVRLTADPSIGWEFSHWEEDLSGDENPIVIQIEKEMTVKAVFNQTDPCETDDCKDEKKDDDDKKDDDKKGDDKKQDDGKGDPEDDDKEPEDDKSDDDKKGDGKDSSDNSSDKGDKGDDKSSHYTIERSVKGNGTVWWEPHSKTDRIPANTKLKLGANPADGWEFSHWEGAFQGRESPVDVTMDKNKSFTAVFVEEGDPEPEPETYILTIDNENSFGTYGYYIDEEWFQLSRPEGHEHILEEGTITLEATPGNTKHGMIRLLSHWGGDIQSEDNPVAVTMNSDMTVYAVFEDFFRVRTNVEGEGEVLIHTSPDAEEDLYYPESMSEITAEAIPADGWEFVEWSSSGYGYGVTENPTTQPLVPASSTITAVFKEIEPETYSLTAMIPGGMNVFIDGSYASPDSPTEFEEGATVEIRAEPVRPRDLVYLFSHWEGEGLQNLEDPQKNPTLITMNSDVTIDPVFDGPYVELRDPRVNGGEGEVTIHTPPETFDGQELYLIGQEIEVEAIPADGYEFVEWGLSFSGTNNPSTQTVDNTPGEAVFRPVDELVQNN